MRPVPPLNDRKQITLYTFRAGISAVSWIVAGDNLIYLVDENNSIRLRELPGQELTLVRGGALYVLITRTHDENTEGSNSRKNSYSTAVQQKYFHPTTAR